MGAPVVSREVKIMPPAPIVANPTPRLSHPHEVSAITVKEQFKMLPVLLTAAAAASLAVFPLNANASFAILWGEIGLFAISIVLSVSRGPKGREP